MALDKNKIIAEATKLVQKGAFDKAIKSYERILAEDPKDVRILLKVGELQQKKGDDHAAAEAFTRVAETYAEQGFFLKSVAVYKQIVKLDPDDVRVNERLAALYQQLGLLSDAMGQLQFMAAAHEKAGDVVRLTDVLKRMVDLDPDNIASSVKLGELYVRAGQAGPATECFRRAAEHLKKHNRADEYLKIAERLAGLTPEDLGLTRELAHLYLNKRDTKRALAKLQLCFKANPKDLETLTLLAQAFHDLGQTSKTVSVYKELAHVYEETGKHQEARVTWRKVLEVAPDDEDAEAALGPPSFDSGPAPALRPGGSGHAGAPPPAPPPRPVVTPPPGPAPGRPPGATAGGARVVPPPPPPAGAPITADAIPKLLTETDVYVKYGLHDKALDHLRKVLVADPNCAEAHERARDIHLSAGRSGEAAACAARAVRAHAAKDALDRAAEALARLRQIDAVHPELLELSALAAAGVVEAAPARGGALSDPGETADDLALSAARDDSDEVVEDEFEGSADEVIEGEGEGLAVPEGRRGDAIAEEAALGSAESEDIEPEPGPRPGAVQDLSDELEEAEFFLQQGLRDEARDSLEGLLARHPGHPEVLRRLDALAGPPVAEARPASTPPPRRPAATPAPARPPPLGAPRASPVLVSPSAGDDSFDIARELAEELGGDAAADAAGAADDFQYSVEDVFNQFKKGVAETVRPEDSATHYDLGIAYKEMGLLDDAVKEFETAMRDRKREVDCLSMIGLCRLAQGNAREAIQTYRRALGSDYLGRDAAKAIHFELAEAYQAAEEPEVALYVFHKIARADPAYRDVTARIQELGGGPGHPPADDRAPRPPGARATVPAPRPAPAAPAGPSVPTAAGGGKKNIGYL